MPAVGCLLCGVWLGALPLGSPQDVPHPLAAWQYVTRPFVAGDQVKLINQEGVEVEASDFGAVVGSMCSVADGSHVHCC